MMEVSIIILDVMVGWGFRERVRKESVGGMMNYNMA